MTRKKQFLFFIHYYHSAFCHRRFIQYNFLCFPHAKLKFIPLAISLAIKVTIYLILVKKKNHKTKDKYYYFYFVKYLHRNLKINQTFENVTNASNVYRKKLSGRMNFTL